MCDIILCVFQEKIIWTVRHMCQVQIFKRLYINPIPDVKNPTSILQTVLKCTIIMQD